MKKLLYGILLLTITNKASAQIGMDTVSTGAGYVNQVWYSLQNGVQATSSKQNWDIAFDVSGMGTAILINSVKGITLWNYPNADTASWNTPDTNGVNSWTKRWNADTSWDAGAFDRYRNPDDQYDVGWGVYNPITHNIIGDSLFIIKLADGTFKKVLINNLIGGVYTFTYGGLDGNSDTTVYLNKADFTGKTLAYYSIETHAAIDREPAAAEWDLVFGQYTSFIPSAYSVSGILTNTGVRTAKVCPIANPEIYVDWSNHTYNNQINVIGYDWKKFNNNEFEIEDSLVFFVKSKSGDLWKLILGGFGGAANGNFIFKKEKLSTAGIYVQNTPEKTNFSVFPNPVQGSQVSLLFNDTHLSDAVINIHNLTGQTVFTKIINQREIHQIFTLNIANLVHGLYLISVTQNGISSQQKLIIQ